MSTPKKLFRLKNCHGWWTRWWCRRLHRIRTVQLATDQYDAEVLRRRLAALIETIEQEYPRGGLPKDFTVDSLVHPEPTAKQRFSKDIGAVIIQCDKALRCLSTISKPRRAVAYTNVHDFTMHCILTRVATCVKLLTQSLDDVAHLGNEQHAPVTQRKAKTKTAKARIP